MHRCGRPIFLQEVFISTACLVVVSRCQAPIAICSKLIRQPAVIFCDPRRTITAHVQTTSPVIVTVVPEALDSRFSLARTCSFETKLIRWVEGTSITAWTMSLRAAPLGVRVLQVEMYREEAYLNYLLRAHRVRSLSTSWREAPSWSRGAEGSSRAPTRRWSPRRGPSKPCHVFWCDWIVCFMSPKKLESLKSWWVGAMVVRLIESTSFEKSFPRRALAILRNLPVPFLPFSFVK